MSSPIRFALLQKEKIGPTSEQLMGVFKEFHHLTDADAVRLAVGAHGILMKHLTRHEARALQRAFKAEGVNVIVVPQDDLPVLPEARRVHRLDLWPHRLILEDLPGHSTSFSWDDVTLIAAGAAQHYEVNQQRCDSRELSFHLGHGSWSSSGLTHKVASDSQMILELLLDAGRTRFEIEAEHFPFKHVIDRPGLSRQEQFIWLTRELGRNSRNAQMNSAARSLCRDQEEKVPVYVNKQALLDEIIWIFWQRLQPAENV